MMNAKECKIFVTVGSRNYPFNRLFIKLDELNIMNGKISFRKKNFQQRYNGLIWL